MQYRKKPVVIDAWQFDGTENTGIPITRLAPNIFFCEGPGDLIELEIETLEGRMTASAGDWIIKGVRGEFYPCKSDVFALTYEAVE